MSSAHNNKDKRKYLDLSYEGRFLLDPKYMTKRDLQHYYRYYNMTKNRSQFKKIIFIILCVCLFSYIFIDYNLKTKIIQLRDRFDFIARVDAEYNITQAYFVNTPGCRMPYFEVIDENIIQFISRRPENFSCRKPLTRTSDEGARLWFNMNAKEIQKEYNVSDLSKAKCHYQEIKRKNDKQNDFLRLVPFNIELNRSIDILPGVEYIGVECFHDDGHVFYKDFHFFVIEKKVEDTSVRRRIKEKLKMKTTGMKKSQVNSIGKKNGDELNESHTKTPRWHFRNAKTSSTTADSNESTAKEETMERVSVLVLGIDSVSHLNFLRQMRHSAAYIHDKLSHVEFWGYNKIGDNTFPNLVPVLTGLDEQELNISCLDPWRHANFDRCNFVWKRFKEAGFKTAFAEDVGQMGVFNYFQPGFGKQPTDYYLRPILLEMEDYISYMHNINVLLCMGGRRTADVVFEFLRKLVPLMSTHDFFSFMWTVTLSHDRLNMPVLLDDELVRVFKSFETANLFNKTVIFLMSDHGMRWGSFRKTFQGMMEERQPILIAIYPPWFRSKFPNAIQNMELNAKRLTSHFDLHATLLDLIDLRRLQDDQIAARAASLSDTLSDTMPRGISLFVPIPTTRTCENAGIAAHWCTCHHRQELATNDGRVQRAARYIIKLINDRLKAHPQCRVLYLNSILEATVAAPHQKIVKEITNDYSIDVTLRIQAKPGLGLFESTVRMSSYSIALTGTISRINLYGSQSYCIDEQALKMFCYCHR